MKVPNLLEDTVISTRTIIADVNVEFDIENIFKNVPLQIQLKNYPCSIVAMYKQTCNFGTNKFVMTCGEYSLHRSIKYMTTV